MSEIANNLTFVQGKNGGKYPYSNSLLVEDEKKVLIDAGAGKEEMEGLAEKVDVDFVINSHCHEDHIAYNHLFESEVYIHQSEAQVLRDVSELANVYAPRGAEERAEVEDFVRGFVNYEGLEDVVGFEDGRTFDLGVTTLKAIHTPGHSRGHCAFFVPEQRILFSADIDLTSFGPWYGALDSDVDEFIRSIQRLRDLKPEVVLPGHGGVIDENVDLEFERYLGKIYEREERMLDFLSEGRTLGEMIGQGLIYRRFPDYLESWYGMMEGIMIKLHLERLLEGGKIRRENSRYQRS